MWKELMQMQTFGEFIKEKRLSIGIEEREFAELAGVSQSLLRAIEKNFLLQPLQKPNQAVLINMAEALKLNDNGNEREKEKFFELAATYKENIPQIVTPILDYIQTDERIREALKIAIENGAKPEDWIAFAQQIKNRNIGCKIDKGR